MKSYPMANLVNELDIELIFIKKTKNFDPLRDGIIQLLDILNLLGGAPGLESLPRAWKTNETKKVFSNMNGSIVRRNCRTMNLQRFIPF